MITRLLKVSALCGVAVSLGLQMAYAKAPSACSTIRLGYGHWVDNKVENAVFKDLVEPLGYHVSKKPASLKATYRHLANGQLDAYLQDWVPDSWMSSAGKLLKSYMSQHKISRLGPDLGGAKHTLVVPAYLYNEGLKNFADIHKFSKQLGYTIYGIEPDNVGDEHILSMIKHNQYDLGHFHLVQDGPATMLHALSRKEERHHPILLLGWQPSSMNIEYQLRYLSGGGDAFGHDMGAAKSFILTRQGYAKDCPNIGKLLSQFRLPVRSESAMMYDVVAKHEKAKTVTKDWVNKHPAWLAKTVAKVMTVHGNPALPAIQKSP